MMMMSEGRKEKRENGEREREKREVETSLGGSASPHDQKKKSDGGCLSPFGAAPRPRIDPLRTREPAWWPYNTPL